MLQSELKRLAKLVDQLIELIVFNNERWRKQHMIALNTID
jgi:hypothetical protein